MEFTTLPQQVEWYPQLEWVPTPLISWSKVDHWPPVEGRLGRVPLEASISDSGITEDMTLWSLSSPIHFIEVNKVVATPLPIHSDLERCKVISELKESPLEWIDLVKQESGSYISSMVGKVLVTPKVFYVGFGQRYGGHPCYCTSQ